MKQMTISSILSKMELNQRASSSGCATTSAALWNISEKSALIPIYLLTDFHAVVAHDTSPQYERAHPAGLPPPASQAGESYLLHSRSWSVPMPVLEAIRMLAGPAD